jgi:hypothetical protein
MTEFKATASEHLSRDLEAGGTWVCACEACTHMRSLSGVQKMIAVRPLVRAIEQTAALLEGMPPSPDRERVLRQHLELHDQLAAVMVR